MSNKKNSFDEPAKVIKRADAPEEKVYSLTFKEAVSVYFKSRFSKAGIRGFIKNSFPQKDDPTKEKVRKIIMDVSFVLLVAGLSYMVFYYFSYRARIEDLKNWETVIEDFNEDELNEREKEKLWEDIKGEYPDVEFPEGMSLKFASLYAVNQDTVGVLSIPEKDLWTPVLQSKYSPSYYLWRDLYGEYNRYGNPYVDYRCDVINGEFSKNIIIYGHNTHDKLGFNKLTEYMSLSGYKEAPVITLETLYEKTQWKIFGVILTNSTSAADRGHLFSYLIADFASTDDFMTMISGIRERSMINTGVDVNASDNILTLYTCYQDIFEGGRLVVFARQVRDGESAEVDVSKASFNHNARYPQAYYDQLELTNPYEHLTTPIEYITDEFGSTIKIDVTDNTFEDPEEEKNTSETSDNEEEQGTSATEPSESPTETTSEKTEETMSVGASEATSEKASEAESESSTDTASEQTSEENTSQMQ